MSPPPSEGFFSGCLPGGLGSRRRRLAVALEDANRRGDDKRTIELASQLLDRSDLTEAERFLALSRRARARLDSGDFAAARSDAQAALDINPASRDEWHNLGIALFKLGHFRAAANSLERAVGLGSLPDTQLWRVAAYCELHDWPAAGNAAEDMVLKHPSEPAALKWRAHVRRRSGDSEGALADYTAALAAAPAANIRAELLSLRSALLADMDRPEEAIRDCDAHLALVPDDRATLVRRAELRERRGDIDGAIADYGKIRDECPYALRHARLLIGKGDHAATLEALTAALARWPRNGDFLRWHDIERARALIEAADRPAARTALDAALVLWPRDPELRGLRGALLLDMAHWREAIADFDVVLRRDRSAAGAWAGRAKAHAELGKPYLALGDARRALALAPADPVALGAQAQARAHLAAAGRG